MASNLNSRQTAISVPVGDLARMVFASMSTTTSAIVASAVTSAIAWRQRIKRRRRRQKAGDIGEVLRTDRQHRVEARVLHGLNLPRNHILAHVPYPRSVLADAIAPDFGFVDRDPHAVPVGNSIAPSTKRIGSAIRSSL